jgi:Outer membrane protein beta-barrel domain
MKKLFITTAALVLAVSGVFAQGISGGLRAGMNLANVDFSGGGATLDTDGKAGFLAGAYLTLMATEKLGVQVEGQYSMQGFKFSDPNVGDIEMDFNYINVPILLRYNVTSFLNVHAGPQIGIMTGAEATFDGISGDIKDSFKSSDFTGVAGVGVDLPFGLNGGLRYNFGLSDNVKDGGDLDGTSIKNRAFQIYVGYTLFGKK